MTDIEFIVISSDDEEQPITEKNKEEKETC